MKYLLLPVELFEAGAGQRIVSGGNTKYIWVALNSKWRKTDFIISICAFYSVSLFSKFALHLLSTIKLPLFKDKSFWVTSLDLWKYRAWDAWNKFQSPNGKPPRCLRDSCGLCGLSRPLPSPWCWCCTLQLPVSLLRAETVFWSYVHRLEILLSVQWVNHNLMPEVVFITITLPVAETMWFS